MEKIDFEQITNFLSEECALLDYYSKNLDSEYIKGRKFELDLIVSNIKRLGYDIEERQDRSIKLSF